MLNIILFVLAGALGLLCVYLAGLVKAQRGNHAVLQENLDHARTKLSDYETQMDDVNYELTQLRVQSSGLRTELNKLKKYQEICEIEQYVMNRKLQVENFVEVTKVDASIMIDDIKGYIERVKQYINQYQAQAFQDIDEQARERLKTYFKQAEQQQYLQEAVQALQNKIQGYQNRFSSPVHELLQSLIEGYQATDAAQHLTHIRKRIQLAVEQNKVASCNYVDDARRRTTIELMSALFNSKADLYLASLTPQNLGEKLQALKDDFSLINLKGQDLSQACIHEDYLNLRLEELKFAAVLKSLQQQTQASDEAMA